MLFDPSFVYRLPAVIIALVFHEYAHAQAADMLGDRTPRYAGRLTLNPLSHLDPIGFLSLWVFRFGWAKPVPINPYNFRNRDRGLLLSSLAGPTMNIFLAFLTLWFMKLTRTPLAVYGGAAIPYYLLMYNVWLAVFNLIPVPPLDGSRALGVLLGPGSRLGSRFFDEMERYGWVVLLILVWSGVIGTIMAPLAGGLLSVLDALAGVLTPF
ncbi:MAG TPA: site-2 protease family protein [Clostridia bacterium]|nr:site-2 protease family protein [Clostridia bacterium]